MRQMIYSSAATEPFSPADLRVLLRKARARNSVYGVSGMLLYHTGSFLQVLEGQSERVETILSSIRRDPRHTQTKVLSDVVIAKREFQEWAMGFIDAGSGVYRPEGLVDYHRLQPLLALNDTAARKYLGFFHTGLCRQTIPAGMSL